MKAPAIDSLYCVGGKWFVDMVARPGVIGRLFGHMPHTSTYVSEFGILWYRVGDGAKLDYDTARVIENRIRAFKVGAIIE